MAAAVARPYACPACREFFMKWGMCQNHIRNSGPCRGALGDKIQDQDALQDMCRNAANSAATQASSVHNQIIPVLFHGGWDSVTDRAAIEVIQHMSPIAVKKLKKAMQNGYLTAPEHAELEDIFDELAEHSFAVQNAAVEKFLALGLGELRWVVDKCAWLLRCIKFSARTNSQEPEGDEKSPQSMLLSALAVHALLPDALTQECWNRFLELDPEEQGSVIGAVRSSLAANVSGMFSDHFLNLCGNEALIFSLQASPPPRLRLKPPPMGWEAIEGTLYHRLLQLLLFRQRNCEEQLFKELADADPDMQPGDPGSLLHTHLATTQARQGGSAEVLALLHAGAVSGLTRACARFIIEGLDVNECTGLQKVTPLHVAAKNGEVQVINLLLQHRADPNIKDADGHTPLYVAVDTAVQLLQTDRDGASAAVTHHTLQMKSCDVLLQGGAENFEEGAWSPESLAAHHQLHSLRNLIRLHTRLANLKHKVVADASVMSDLQKLQYETAIFTVAVFEKHLMKHVNIKTGTAELRAFIASDFIQERNKIQALGNRLAKRTGIVKKVIDNLVNLPPAAAMYVLSNFKFEETVPGIFEVPDHLNNVTQESLSAEQTASSHPGEGADNDGINQSQTDATDGPANQSEDNANGTNLDERPKLEGRVRKWDSERGFGFVVQDMQPGEETQKDIFVHRSNVVGSTASNPINLRENCRISYRLGEHDGRLRALDATMIDAQSKPLPIHSGVQKDADQNKRGADGSDNELDEEEVISRRFNAFIRSRPVQELAKEKRAEVDSWLRCVGLRKQNAARRDDTVWKKEVDARIDLLVEKQTTPLLQRDFDFRCKRFLHEFCAHSNVTRASELLALIESSTAGKNRDDVRSWPAYIATLLRKFEPRLYETLADRDRRSRIEMRRQRLNKSNGKAPAASDTFSVADIDALTENLDEHIDDDQLVDEDPTFNEDSHLYGEDDANDSPPPVYSPRSSEAASSKHSSDSEVASPREKTVVYEAPSSDATQVSGGPGANLFRYKGENREGPEANDMTSVPQKSAALAFQ